MLETKLVAGRTGYDVVVPSANFLARQIKSGLFLAHVRASTLLIVGGDDTPV